MADAHVQDPPEATAIGGTTWVMVVGAMFGAITLAGLFVVAIIAGARPSFICNSFVALAAVFAFGAALSGAFIGGAAGARGQLGLGPGMNSLAYSLGGGVAVLVIALYVFKSLQPPNCNANAMTFVHGTLSYSIPAPAGDGDLVFQFAGTNPRLAGNNVFSSESTGTEHEKYLLYPTDTEVIQIVIRNRPVYGQCDEDNPAAPGTRSRTNKTTYRIKLEGALAESHDPSQQYRIDFEYNPRSSSARPNDFLTVRNFKNVDPKRVSVVVSHDPEHCFAEREAAANAAGVASPFYLIDAPRVAAAPASRSAASPAPLAARLLAALQLGWIGGAAAAAADDSESLLRLLRSADRGLVTKGQIVLANNPQKYLDLIERLLGSEQASDRQVQVYVLEALHTYSAKTYRLPDSILQKILTLTFAPQSNVRAAARSYLIDPSVLGPHVVEQMKSFVAAKSDALKGIAGQQSLVWMMITARDIYYNAGVKGLSDYRGDYGKRERHPGAIGAAKRDFELGIDLIKDVPADQNVPFAKSYYGLALALDTEAMVSEAERALGPGATSAQIEARLTAKVPRREPLPFSPEGRSQFMATIDKFLALVEGHESKYLWPDHIAQLRSCRAAPVYGCFRVTPATPPA
jgi:hypothetical protein